jgi:uncharacterized protein
MSAESMPVTSPPTAHLGTETRDGMAIDWDVPITMDDGLVLRADVYRPARAGRYPASCPMGHMASGCISRTGTGPPGRS